MIKQNQNFKQRVKTCNLIGIFSVEKWKILQNILPLKKVQLGIIFTSDTNEQRVTTIIFWKRIKKEIVISLRF